MVTLEVLTLIDAPLERCFDLARSVEVHAAGDVHFGEQAPRSRTLRQAWGVPVGLPAFGWMIEVGTFLMRTESELVLKSRRVVPTRLLEAGFEFAYPVWEGAARDLVRRWIAQRR